MTSSSCSSTSPDWIKVQAVTLLTVPSRCRVNALVTLSPGVSYELHIQSALASTFSSESSSSTSSTPSEKCISTITKQLQEEAAACLGGFSFRPTGLSTPSTTTATTAIEGAGGDAEPQPCLFTLVSHNPFERATHTFLVTLRPSFSEPVSGILSFAFRLPPLHSSHLLLLSHPSLLPPCSTSCPSAMLLCRLLVRNASSLPWDSVSLSIHTDSRSPPIVLTSFSLPAGASTSLVHSTHPCDVTFYSLLSTFSSLSSSNASNSISSFSTVLVHLTNSAPFTLSDAIPLDVHLNDLPLDNPRLLQPSLPSGQKGLLSFLLPSHSPVSLSREVESRHTLPTRYSVSPHGILKFTRQRILSTTYHWSLPSSSDQNSNSSDDLPLLLEHQHANTDGYRFSEQISALVLFQTPTRSFLRVSSSSITELSVTESISVESDEHDLCRLTIPQTLTRLTLLLQPSAYLEQLLQQLLSHNAALSAVTSRLSHARQSLSLATADADRWVAALSALGLCQSALGPIPLNPAASIAYLQDSVQRAQATAGAVSLQLQGLQTEYDRLVDALAAAITSLEVSDRSIDRPFFVNDPQFSSDPLLFCFTANDDEMTLADRIRLCHPIENSATTTSSTSPSSSSIATPIDTSSSVAAVFAQMVDAIKKSVEALPPAQLQVYSAPISSPIPPSTPTAISTFPPTSSSTPTASHASPSSEFPIFFSSPSSPSSTSSTSSRPFTLKQETNTSPLVLQSPFASSPTPQHNIGSTNFAPKLTIDKSSPYLLVSNIGAHNIGPPLMSQEEIRYRDRVTDLRNPFSFGKPASTPGIVPPLMEITPSEPKPGPVLTGTSLNSSTGSTALISSISSPFQDSSSESTTSTAGFAFGTPSGGFKSIAHKPIIPSLVAPSTTPSGTDNPFTSPPPSTSPIKPATTSPTAHSPCFSFQVGGGGFNSPSSAPSSPSDSPGSVFSPSLQNFFLPSTSSPATSAPAAIPPNTLGSASLHVSFATSPNSDPPASPFQPDPAPASLPTAVVPNVAAAVEFPPFGESSEPVQEANSQTGQSVDIFGNPVPVPLSLSATAASSAQPTPSPAVSNPSSSSSSPTLVGVNSSSSTTIDELLTVQQQNPFQGSSNGPFFSQSGLFGNLHAFASPTDSSSSTSTSSSSEPFSFASTPFSSQPSSRGRRGRGGARKVFSSFASTRKPTAVLDATTLPPAAPSDSSSIPSSAPTVEHTVPSVLPTLSLTATPPSAADDIIVSSSSSLPKPRPEDLDSGDDL